MSKRGKQLATVAALVILVASTVVYARVALEVLVVAPPLLPSIVAPAVVFSAVLLGLSGVVYYRIYRSPEFDAELPERGNPAQIKLALTFGALYAAILIAVAAARDLIGDDAIYGVAFVSGLTDVDALTLSISQVFQRGEIGSGIAWRAIFLASLSNLLFKMVAVAVLGSAELRRWIWATGGVALLAGVALLVLWP